MGLAGQKLKRGTRFGGGLACCLLAAAALKHDVALVSEQPVSKLDETLDLMKHVGVKTGYADMCTYHRSKVTRPKKPLRFVYSAALFEMVLRLGDKRNVHQAHFCGSRAQN